MIRGSLFRAVAGRETWKTETFIRKPLDFSNVQLETTETFATFLNTFLISCFFLKKSRCTPLVAAFFVAVESDCKVNHNYQMCQTGES